MPDPPTSAVRRALAAELRRLREETGMSGDEIADRLGWSGSKISRIETYRTGVKTADLRRLLDLYEVDDARGSQLMALAAQPETRGWWSGYASTFPADYLSYIALEDSAATLRAWSPELIHGLLQTEDYAAAALAAVFGTPPRIPPGEIQRRIEARLRRQALLTRSDDGDFRFVLDEAVLRHGFGTAATMRAQLARLDELSRQPGSTIRVLPFAGPHPVGPGGFAILSFGPVYGMRLNDVVYVEHMTGQSLLADEQDTYEYRQAYRKLTDAALDADESRALIGRVAREHWA
jgi:transcriptional regulator with XRE-family HTH domain